VTVVLRGKKNEEEIRKDRNLLGLFEFLKTFVANQKIPVALTRYQVTIFQIKGNKVTVSNFLLGASRATLVNGTESIDPHYRTIDCSIIVAITCAF
jgi:hypothetical protein